MVNYYYLLEIAYNASNDEIVSAIKRARRLWNNRANNPDGKIRAEAERHIREIAEAEDILLNSTKRTEYNYELSQKQNNTGTSETTTDNPDDWEEEYFKAYDSGLTEYAEEVAQRATRANDRDGRAWFLYGEAIRRGGNSAGAIGPLRRASILLPNDARVFRQLGFAYLDEKRPDEALVAFGDASKCDPKDCEFYCLRAALYRDYNMIDDALREAKKAIQIAPNDDDAKFEYFFALYEDALRSMSYNRSSGKHLIINLVQLNYVKNLLKDMAVIIQNDKNKRKCDTAMDTIIKIVADAESKKGGVFISKPGYQYNYDISNADTRSTGKR